MAQLAGVTVLAVVMTDPHVDIDADGGPGSALESLTSRLGVAGADKVLVCEGVGLSAPALDVTHGQALLSLAEHIPPLVVLFPTGGPGPELGPPLAARLGGAFGGCSDLEVSDEKDALPNSVGRLHLRRWRGDRTSYRRLDPVEIERPVIAIVGAFGDPRQLGTSDVEVEVVPSVVPADPKITVLESEPDDRQQVELAHGLVVTAADVDPKIVAQLQAAAPAGVVVTESRHAGRGALAFALPEFVLQIGTPHAPIGGSPRTRVGRIVLNREPEPDTAAGSRGAKEAGLDVVWRPTGEVAWDELAAALAAVPSASKAQ